MTFISALAIVLATTAASPFGDCGSTLLQMDPPDKTAQLFLPGIVSGPTQEYGLAVTEDWTEIYFTRESTLMVVTCEDQELLQPVVAPFSGRFIDGHPCLLPGGEPQNLGPGVNTEHIEGSPTLSLDGRFLFFSRHQDIWWVSTEVIEKLRP
jgi:hypothetical protein